MSLGKEDVQKRSQLAAGMTNFQVGGCEQTAETCVKAQGSAPST